ncbi:ABC transporter permease [Candidatus Entotheonella palauensis]|uniref:ABC transporter permease n=1 Tax=Candidatus Entotheonella palauensis TaxID=93172 RepID=UPI000B7DC37B|nr:ABC transporter permease [Candidatus Entotheonella palauensis]
MIETKRTQNLPLADDRGSRSPFVDVCIRTFKNPQGKIGVFVLLIMMICAVGAEVLGPYGEREQTEGARLLGPSLGHLLGTDEIGRDIFSRLLYGLRASLVVSLTGVTVGAIIGSFIGFAAGYIRGMFETVVMRLVDAMLAFPSLLAGIAVLTILGPGIRSVTIAIAVFNFPVFARLARAGALAEGVKDYVMAERSIGASAFRILYRHIAVNALSPLVVQLALSYAFAVLAESALSFLGLGVQPPNASLGTMIQRGRGFLYKQLWYAVAPGTVLALMLVSFNFIADAFNEANDPKRRR